METNRRNLTLAQIERYNKTRDEMDSRCREQFIRNARTWLRRHPEAGGRIPLDPNATFQGCRTTKYGGSYPGDIVAVSFDAEGRVLFDHHDESGTEKDLHCTLNTENGVYVEDWPWALQILLEHLEAPYVPNDANAGASAA
jgi:hypothetical protein